MKDEQTKQGPKKREKQNTYLTKKKPSIEVLDVNMQD